LHCDLLFFTVTLECSADRNWSRFVQQAIEVATPEEMVMVYMEIMPCVRTLAVDMFGNHALQKVKFLPFDSVVYMFFYLTTRIFEALGHKLSMTSYRNY